MAVKSEKHKTGYVYNLTANDFMIRKNGCIVLHKPSRNNDYSVGSIHESNHCGLFKIIPPIDRHISGKVSIEFLSTGSKLTVTQCAVKNGLIKDPDIWKVLIGKIYKTNTSGKLQIISLHSKVNGMYRFNVRFLDSGYETDAAINKILIGKVADHSKFRSPEPGEIFTSNQYGEFVIVKYIGKIAHDREYKIRFLNTGYERNAALSNIYHGEVKDPTGYVEKSPNKLQEERRKNTFSMHKWKRDPYKITVCGVGYLGETYYDFMMNDSTLYEKLYKRWRLMLRRCYNENDSGYHNYGEIGISVDKRWYNLSNYLNDVVTLPGFDRDMVVTGELQLDKDKLQKDRDPSEKVYSKDTCCWLTTKENNSFNMIKSLS